jgi:hypothetical protein
MLFDSWYDILDIVVVGICTYIILETNGSLSVLTGINGNSALLSNVQNYSPETLASSDVRMQVPQCDT